MPGVAPALPLILVPQAVNCFCRWQLLAPHAWHHMVRRHWQDSHSDKQSIQAQRHWRAERAAPFDLDDQFTDITTHFRRFQCHTKVARCRASRTSDAADLAVPQVELNAFLHVVKICAEDTTQRVHDGRKRPLPWCANVGASLEPAYARREHDFPAARDLFVALNNGSDR